jgi:predicted anti-sigma-YlaC factor YlaD
MMMSCEIIKDLLPLYLDGVCSGDSKAEIEEHLASCDSCRADLQTMQTALPIGGAEQNLKDAQAVKNLSRKWKKGMIKSMLKGVLIAIGVIVALALIAYLIMDFRVVF